MDFNVNDYYYKRYTLKVLNSKVSDKLEDILSYIYDTYPQIECFDLVDYDIRRKYTYITLENVVYNWDIIV